MTADMYDIRAALHKTTLVIYIHLRVYMRYA